MAHTTNDQLIRNHRWKPPAVQGTVLPFGHAAITLSVIVEIVDLEMSAP